MVDHAAGVGVRLSRSRRRPGVRHLDARTGTELWRHQLAYNTLSSPVVIGPLVYVADRGASGSVSGHVYAYNPGNGRLVWQFHDGKYSPAIAAAGRLVVVGFGRLYVLKPRG